MKKNNVKTIALIGAGYSGTVTAINLLRLAHGLDAPFRLVLIDTAASYGKGLAYSTQDDNLVLNVPTGNMSAFPDKPDDFLEFCNGMDTSLVPGSFVFRRVYGEYLETRLREAIADNPDTLVALQDFVIAITQRDAGYILKLRDGDPLEADIVVLAFGHFPPRPLAEILGGNASGLDLPKDTCLDNPWDIRALDRLPVDKDVLIVGTGHTAIDTLFRLVSCSSLRKIYLVSRHGHTPNGHRKAGEFVKMPLLTQEVEKTVRAVLDEKPTIRALFSSIRKLAQRYAALQINWRDVISSLRQITPEIWQKLPAGERARFLRHVVHHWDVMRHRLAPVAIRRLDGLMAAGLVEIIAGRVIQLRATPGGKDISASIKLRGSDQRRELVIGSVINCSGPSYDIRRIHNPLLRQLADEGTLHQDEARIGFAVDENYRCSTAPNLYYIGPMLKARYWEAIAVPELRVHALKLAKLLLERIAQV